MHHDLEEFWKDFLSASFNSSGGGPELIFRGVTDKNHTLTPSIGRHPRENTGNDISALEDDFIAEFKRLSIPELEAIPNNELEWLFLAQHYGLPTRLLDWSTNPLVALFFAAEKEDDKDGAIYMVSRMVTDQYELFDFRTADYTAERRKEPAGIFAIQPTQGEVIFVRPKYKDRRYQNQKSVFSCPRDPYTPLQLDGMRCIEFDKNLKPRLRERLKKMGVSTSFIYPGLGGIASEVKSLKYDPVQSGRTKIITMRCEIKI
ncbi:FRG domain-containing protein [Pseudomonas sp. 1928-m]|uniref:FRG domain-containing protein n=1 Tax=Pseudomonas sp. 1928-m TaxID=3033804 RepID=UPI0023DE8F13|nr:FRG domain-containing protein [Pseudomonas sp. 1928-m]MDF3196590.1 FRG domain-containing protein [Pseudomonas sp. 1928-m]